MTHERTDSIIVNVLFGIVLLIALTSLVAATFATFTF